MNPDKAIPSMFHRRLILLAAMGGLVMVGLGAQLARLTVLEGDRRLAEAEGRLRQETYLAAPRANILDRRGVVLARDTPSYDIAVEYEVISGVWSVRKATSDARRELGRQVWDEMSPEERAAELQPRIDHYDQQVEMIWRQIMLLGNVTREELDTRLDLIRRTVQRRAEFVWRSRAEAMMEAKHARTWAEASAASRQPILEQKQPHVILPRVPDAIAFEFRYLQSQWPDMLEVQDSTRREYPETTRRVTLNRATLPRAIRSDQALDVTVIGVADHTLGTMHDAWAEDIQRRPFHDSSAGRIDLKGYRQDDVVGARGLEQRFEDQLRGTRGVVRRRLDSDEVQRIDRQPGEDVKTTLGIELQARIQAILSPEFGLTRVQQWQAGWNADGSPRPAGLPLGTPLNSAAVVIEVESGEILAMVSYPTIAMAESMDDAERSRSGVWINRPVEAIYPPGSIIKPLVLAAAVTEGVLASDGRVECNGHYYPDRQDIARCWIYREHYGYRGHGSLDAVAAISQSCNVYFYTLGARLGIARLTEWYRRFGLGSPLDIGLLTANTDESGPDLLGEVGGQIPNATDIESLEQSGAVRFETIIMAIGQGPVTWTPVQAANAYAMLARRGVVRDATLIADSSRQRLVDQRDDIKLSAAVVDRALEGLRQSVETREGTGHHISYPDGSREPIINANGVTVWAKTGTAQAPDYVVDLNQDGQAEAIKDLNHAWFVGLVGPKGAKKPQYAIAVIVEYGGSGGRTSGPIANQIIHALQGLGYLDDGEGTT